MYMYFVPDEVPLGLNVAPMEAEKSEVVGLVVVAILGAIFVLIVLIDIPILLSDLIRTPSYRMNKKH